MEKKTTKKETPKTPVASEVKKKVTKKEERVLFACKTCHKPFSLTISHLKWFEEKGIPSYAHCSECRKKRKEDAMKSQQTTISDPAGMTPTTENEAKE